MQAFNWNEVEAQQEGEFKRIKAGGYVCKITDAVDVPDKQYVLVTMDIAEGDLAGFGAETEKRTGNTFGYLQAYRSYRPSARGFFKSFLTVLDYSNARFDSKKFDNDEKKFIGLTIGVVVQEEEYVGKNKEGNAVKKIRPRVYSVVDVKKIRQHDFKTPELKVLSDEDAAKLDSYNGGDYTPFSDNGAVADEGCPF